MRDPTGGGRWDFCAGVLPNKINPTDIDLCIEHNGYFLIMEGKQTGEGMDTGQRRFLEALCRIPQVTVIEFEGTKPNVIRRYRRWPEGEWRLTTTADFNKRIQGWHGAVTKRRAA